MGDYDTAEKAAKETLKLQETRRDFEKLRKEEESYLQEREEKERDRLAGIRRSISTATKLFEKVGEKAASAVRRYREAFTALTERIDGLLDDTETIVASANTAKEKLEKGIEAVEEQRIHVVALTKEVSAREKTVKKDEQKVAKLNKDADAKLQEARQLADWAQNPKVTRYTVPRRTSKKAP